MRPFRNLARERNWLTSPRLRKSNKHNHNTERAKSERRNVTGDRTDNDGDYGQTGEIKIEHEYTADDLPDAKPVISRALVEMRSMRVPEPFASCNPSEQGNRRVRSEEHTSELQSPVH